MPPGGLTGMPAQLGVVHMCTHTSGKEASTHAAPDLLPDANALAPDFVIRWLE
jgi:hypothetical protein